MRSLQSKRFFLSLFRALLVFLALVMALLAFLVSSQTGTRYALGLAVEAVDGLAVSRVQGTLLGPLVLRGVEYSGSTLEVNLPQVELDWTLRDLWKRELNVTRLKVTGGTVVVVEPAVQPEDVPFKGLVLPESLGLPVSLSLSDASVRQLAVHTSAAQITIGSLALDGVLDRAGDEASEIAAENTVNLKWSDLALLEPGQGKGELRVVSATGALTVSGEPVDYTVQGNTLLELQNAQSIQLAVAGEGDQRGLRLNKVNSSLAGGEVMGDVRLSWSQGIGARVALEGAGFEPEQWHEDFPGNLDFKLRASIENDQFAVEQLALEGVVREEPVALDAVLSIAGDAAAVDSFNGSIGSTRFFADGHMGSELNFKWQVNSPDLEALLPDARGSFQSEGSLTGSRDQPSLRGSFALNAAKYDGYAAQSVTANVAIDLATDVSSVSPTELSRVAQSAPSTLALQVKGLRVQDTTVSAATLALDGTLGSHTLNVSAVTDSGDLAAKLAGGWHDGTWSGVWQQGEIAPATLAGWKLQAPHSLTLSREQQKIEQACWRVSGSSDTSDSDTEHRGSACYSATRTPARTLVDFKLQSLALAYFEPLAPQEVRLEGQINAIGSLQQLDGGNVALNATIDSSPAALHGDSTLFVQSLALDPGRITVNGTAAELRAAVELPFSAGGGLDGTVVLNDLGTAAASPLSGRLEASVPDLSFLSVISSEIEKLSGSATLLFSLAGTVQAPRPEGELLVENMQLALLTPGIVLEEVTLSASGDTAGNIAFVGSALSDGGRLGVEGGGQWVVSGDADNQSINPGAFTARIRGDNFRFWNTRDAVLRGSPDLALSLSDEKIRLEGEVFIPRARITPVELPPSAVRPSDDQVIILPEEGEINALEQQVSENGVYADLKLRLGDDVSIDGFGFKGGLGGELGITMAPGKPVLASGELNVVDGEYRAFGQGLVVERGQLLFAGGDIENPGLNIRAQRRPAADVVVGVNVTGQLQKPSVKLFSEPDMGSSNQLAWLVLGRPFENTSGAETDYISQAALLLGIQGGDYLAKGVGEKLGLDTVGIETGSGEAGAASDVNQAALVVGKYLTPRLYISYGVGLLDSLSTVKLRYQINDRWNLVTESSPIASGGDLNYTIER